MKAPVMSKLMTLMASILIVFILAFFQEAVAAGSAAATGGALVIKTHPLSKTGKKNVTTPKTKTNTLNLHQPLAGSTLITYTYDNNGNLINKTKVAGP